VTDEAQPQTTRKRTPKDASEFEREQLRFFLAEGDLAATLASVNPSLAWLPDLVQMKLVKGERQVIGWIEHNFASPEAIKDVVDNIAFFGPESAQALEYRLNAQSSSLAPLIAHCWQLVIQQMRLAKPLLLQNQWFQIAPRIAQGDRSGALLERIAETLRPRPKLGKRLSLHGIPPDPPEKPSDILSVKFEVDDGASGRDVLEAWPADEAAENDHRLLLHLTAAMSAALGEATDAGVERNDGFTESDFDVPSVAPHDQNRYRTGFSAIVQVTAELWLRLARKAPELALDLVQRWRGGQYRLLRRLALFASGNPIVPAQSAAETLIDTPNAELFLFASSVEVLRLIRGRWNEFPSKKRQTILRRLREGPAQREFREGADVDRRIAATEALDGLDRDADRERSEKAGLGQRRHRLDLGVAEGMIGVGRLVGLTHGEEGEGARPDVNRSGAVAANAGADRPRSQRRGAPMQTTGIARDKGAAEYSRRGHGAADDGAHDAWAARGGGGARAAIAPDPAAEARGGPRRRPGPGGRRVLRPVAAARLFRGSGGRLLGLHPLVRARRRRRPGRDGAGVPAGRVRGHHLAEPPRLAHRPRLPLRQLPRSDVRGVR